MKWTKQQREAQAAKMRKAWKRRRAEEVRSTPMKSSSTPVNTTWATVPAQVQALRERVDALHRAFGLED